MDIEEQDNVIFVDFKNKKPKEGQELVYDAILLLTQAYELWASPGEADPEPRAPRPA